MQSSSKIFDIDKNNSANAVRKTEEHVVNTNAEQMEPSVVQNTEQVGQQSADRVQRNMMPYQTNNAANNQDVIYPFFSDQMIN